eukprot:g43354.t1
MSVNVGKAEELIIDFRKKGGEHAPIYVNGTEVERVNSIKFLRVTKIDDLSWTSHVNATVKKAQRCLFVLGWLRKFVMFLTNFYRCTVESILSRYIMAWYHACSAQDPKYDTKPDAGKTGAGDQKVSLKSLVLMIIMKEERAVEGEEVYFKKKTIIQISKKNHAACLNDYHPVTLTSIIMKCFE